MGDQLIATHIPTQGKRIGKNVDITRAGVEPIQDN
jgi:hypothetical protein